MSGHGAGTTIDDTEQKINFNSVFNPTCTLHDVGSTFSAFTPVDLGVKYIYKKTHCR